MNGAHSSPTPISSKPTSTAPNSSDRQNPLPIQVRVKAMALTHLRPRFRQNPPPPRQIQATVKTLCRFKCVSKPWRSLISDLDFVKTHLHRAEFKRLILASPNSHYSIDHENPFRKQRLPTMATSSSSAVPTAANAAPRLSSAGMVVATSTAVATSSSSAVPTAANAAPRTSIFF
uniref:F-box domain-containing protein n=1 Tax=Fagus sylvatica TaxID=28930 RepID=A0A2N9GDG8_FAGSY